MTDEDSSPKTEEGYLRVDSVKIHYVAAGKGRGLLLLHGLGGSAVSWKYTVVPLSTKYRVYAIDLPGHGRSDKPEINYSLEYSRQFLTGFLVSSGLEKASMVGNSTGGLMALDYALNTPQRVEKLVLVDSAGLGRELHLFLRLITVPLLGEILARPSRLRVRFLLNQVLCDPGMITPELVEEIYCDRSMPGASRSLLRIIRAGVNLAGLKKQAVLLGRLPSLRVPTLIVWGMRDRLIPVAHAYAAHKLIPGSRLSILDSCGHWPQVEKSEEFNKLVLDFLNEKRN